MPDQIPPNNIAARALELASGDNAVLKLHLDECRDRYSEVRKSIEALASLMWKGGAALIILLITIIGFLITKSVSFGVHP